MIIYLVLVISERVSVICILIAFSLSIPEQRTNPSPFCQVFPTEVSCTFPKVAPSGNTDDINGLCMLSHNTFNQKMYLILWFWMVTLFCIVLPLHLAYKLCILMCKCSRFGSLLLCKFEFILNTSERNWTLNSKFLLLQIQLAIPMTLQPKEQFGIFISGAILEIGLFWCKLEETVACHFSKSSWKNLNLKSSSTNPVWKPANQVL